MNKEMVKKFIEDVKIGNTYSNLEIEGLSKTESDAVLQELARKNNIQFYITYDNSDDIYAVVSPSKKFINKLGQWNMPISKKAKEFLDELYK